MLGPSKLCSRVNMFGLEGNIPLAQQVAQPSALRQHDQARLESKSALFGADQNWDGQTLQDDRDDSDDYAEEEAMVRMIESGAAEQLHSLDRPRSQWWHAWNRPTTSMQGQARITAQQDTRTPPSGRNRNHDRDDDDPASSAIITESGIIGPSTASRFTAILLSVLALCAIVWVASPLAGAGAATFTSVPIGSDLLLKQSVVVFRRLQSFLPPWRTRQVQGFSLEERWPNLRWTLKGTHHTDHGDTDLMRKLQVDLNLVDQKVLVVEQQLKAFIEEMTPRRNDGQRSEWAEVTVVELVRGKIPLSLAVVKEPGTGVIRVPAKFWQAVRKLLAAEFKDGKTTISNEKSPEEDTFSQGEEADGGNLTWDGFLKENALALQNLVDERIEVYSRDQFLNLVRAETRLIWAGIEKRLFDRFPRFQCGSECTSFDSAPKTKDDILWELASRAVEEHPADALEKPDLALYNAGGRIIPELTFTDYFQHKQGLGIKTWPRRLLARLFFTHSLASRLAEKAIQPSMHAGDCWAMNSSVGQIGIRLIRSAVVTAVTIEHVDPRVALDKGSAPRNIEVWSLTAPLEGRDGKSRAESRHSEELRQSPITGTWWKEGSPCPGAGQLTAFEYKSRTQYGSDKHQLDQQQKKAREHVPSLKQTFQIPLSRQKAASRGIVLRINSNWGHPDFTCLYRVRVHGFPR
ncbi:hypothetical protein BGZ70_004845 [Mortierella alpina]|uniref:SUN domain-containing protein n=1 Tax=Mortierella alpina TaxID=64518 RepID=A0A9P6JA79_MORAP|nr:hypothetical protein BGZ70_004845 [Mortierella alpina]